MKSKFLLIGSFITVFCLLGCDKDEEKDVAIKSIAIAPSINDMEIGNEVEVTATVTPSDAVGTVTWASANSGIVTVTAKDGTNGRTAIIKAIGAGSTTITASSGNIKSGNLSVAVKEPAPVVIPVTAISIPSSVPDMEIDGTVEVEATVTPASATEAVEWVAVDGTGKVTIAAVSGTNGRKATITAVSAGTAEVYAKSGTVESSKLAVTVKEPEPPEDPEPAEDYASDVVGVYYGEGVASEGFFPQLNGPVEDVVIVLERVHNGKVTAEITATLPMVGDLLGPSVMSCNLTVSADYKLSGSASLDNPLDPTDAFVFTITGSVDPDENTIVLNLTSENRITLDLSASMPDFASAIVGEYHGEGVASEGFFPQLNGTVTDVVIVLEKVNNLTVMTEITATLPMVGDLLGPSVMSCNLTVSSEYGLAGETSLDNPLDPTDAFTFIITGSVDPEAKTIVMNLTSANRITLDLTAEIK